MASHRLFQFFNLPFGCAGAEFDRFELVRETRWATPDWTWLLHEGEALAAFYHLVERTVRIDGVAVRVAGLNNFITLPACRGRGLGSSLLQQTQAQWFDQLGAQSGLLLCADALIPFYTRLGWIPTHAKVTFAQPAGTRTWVANCMLLVPAGRQDSGREIDLCGLPW